MQHLSFIEIERHISMEWDSDELFQLLHNFIFVFKIVLLFCYLSYSEERNSKSV